jgi:hypothetical protein
VPGCLASLRLVMRDYVAFRAMRTAGIEPRTILGSLHAARRDLPQFSEAASCSRSSGSARRLSITLTRPAGGAGKIWVIHVSKSDIPLDLLSLTLKQRFPCDWRIDCAIADVSFPVRILLVLTLRQTLLLSRVERG